MKKTSILGSDKPMKQNSNFLSLFWRSTLIKYYTRSLFLVFLIFNFYRSLFIIFNRNELQQFNGEEFLQSCILGARFDLRLSAIIVVLSLLTFLFKKWPRFHLKCLYLYWAFIFFLANLTYMLDAGYYLYLKARLNSTIISFLKNPLISLQMVKESYPLLLLTFIYFASIAICIFLIKALVLNNLALDLKLYHSKKTSLKLRVVRLIFIISFSSLSIYGSFKLYPLRWSEAFHSTNAFWSQVSLNPLLYFVDTYTFKNSEYDKVATQSSYDQVAKYLGVTRPDRNLLNYARVFPENKMHLDQKRNVVVIIMESMAYYKTGLGGSKVNPTPVLDNLALSSVVFHEFYTPTVATARSIFAAMTGLPDVTKVKSGTRNPFIVDQNSLLDQHQNYDKFYFIGGSANWGNIRGVLTYNISNLNLFEEGKYKSKRQDVWGISDYDMFTEALQYLNSRENPHKPFVGVIQTAGFHRPYTIPENIPGFKKLSNNDIDQKLLKDYGFDSIDELNSLRLQDYSLGHFLDKAKKEKWYDNTLFIIFGDHGLSHNNAINVENWRRNLNNSFHVPLIVHGPKFFKPVANYKIASELDIMPTIAGLTGIAYKTRGLGHDLFSPEPKKRYAFGYNWYAPFNYSLIDEEFYYEFIPYSKSVTFLKHQSQEKDRLDSQTWIQRYPDKFREMSELAQGFMSSSQYLLYHNSKNFKDFELK